MTNTRHVYFVLKGTVHPEIVSAVGENVTKCVCVLQEGYWELTTELGELLNVDVDLFANVFLKNKGIQSLGEMLSCFTPSQWE